MGHGEKFSAIKNGSNFDHKGDLWYLTIGKTSIRIYSDLFDYTDYAQRVLHLHKLCELKVHYSVLNCSAKELLRDFSNMACYAGFKIS